MDCRWSIIHHSTVTINRFFLFDEPEPSSLHTARFWTTVDRSYSDDVFLAHSWAKQTYSVFHNSSFCHCLPILQSYAAPTLTTRWISIIDTSLSFPFTNVESSFHCTGLKYVSGIVSIFVQAEPISASENCSLCLISRLVSNPSWDFLRRPDFHFRSPSRVSLSSTYLQ